MSGFVIDRFEGPDWAVLEDEQARTFSVPRGWLPESAREGDLLDVSEQLVLGSSYLRFSVVERGREGRLAEMIRRRELLPKAPKGDIAL